MAARVRSSTPEPAGPRFRAAAWIAAMAAGWLVALAPAAAETRLCNRTSLVTEAAIGVVASDTAATRGWFRLDPGQCRAILTTAEPAGKLFLHTRAVTEPAGAGLGPAGAVRLCVGEGDFLVAAALACRDPRHRLAGFTEMRPTVVDGIAVLFLSEEADYDLPQARRAGIQRLLTRMGYDPGPIDGLEGPRSEQAVKAFLADRHLAPDSAGAPDFFDTLIAALKAGEGPGFAWCNDSGFRVMAALGVEEGGQVVTRGWYRIEPGACLKPPVDPAARRVYSYGEAVDAQGRPVLISGKPLTYGGEVGACIRPAEFEIAGASDCAAHGATQAAFLEVGFDGRRRATVRFREPQ
ncbi:hypothetical protein BN1110_01630 [bacterium YEK0313]|nr:hypothetical protein BN1110_01630 [bacterium YEK0313]